MSRNSRDDYRALERKSDPAWLWDVDRSRIVWANRSGLAFWGEVTVLDLIDRQMDTSDAAVANMSALGATLEAGASIVESFIFEIDGRAEPLHAECCQTTLEDGRKGLLVVRSTKGEEETAPGVSRSSLLEAVVAGMPVAVVVFDRHGSLLFQNQAATDMLSSDDVPNTNDSLAEGIQPGILASWMEDGARAEELLGRTLMRGSMSATEIFKTRFGPRATRVNTRRLAAPVVGRLAVLLVLEDIEDRRRHEQRQAQTLDAIEAILEAADATFEIDRNGNLTEIGGLANRIFGDAAGELIGAHWDDALASQNINGATPFADWGPSAKPWREVVSTQGSEQGLTISATPIMSDSGECAGYRGLILAIKDVPELAKATATAPENAEPAAPDGLEKRPLSDEEEFRLDMEADDSGAPVHPVSPTIKASASSEPAMVSGPVPDTIGRDDAAAFSAIAEALGKARRPAVPPVADAPADMPPGTPPGTPAGGATLRVVGGVESASAAEAPAAELTQFPTPVGSASPDDQPALIHRHFSILTANDQLARLLGHSTADTMLQDPNLLNLLPDERARLFSLQSRFDDQNIPDSGRIEGVALKARMLDRTTIDLEASLEQIDYDGETAIRFEFTSAADISGEPSLDNTGPGPGAAAVAAAQPSFPQMAVAEARAEPPMPVETPQESEALHAAQARESELRAVINTAADGIATIDEDGKIVTLNASAEAIFAVEAGKVAGEKFSERFSAKGAQTIDAYLASVTSSDGTRLHREGHEVDGKVANGATVPLFVTIGRMNVEDGTRYCAVIRDISQWKEMEVGLRLAKEQAEADSSKKSDFLARISHELRTPLNAIIGFSEVMTEEKFGPIANDRYKGYLNDIRSSGGHLLSLINDLLDLSKIEAGKLDLNFASVDVARVIEQGVAIIQPQASREKVIVRVSLPDHLPSVVADERALRQIVLNLLSNAVKFTPPGGQVILSGVVDDQGRLQIRVRDTGVGMSAQDIERAMEPFRQIDPQEQTDHTGTGLGLPLTKALTEANRAEFNIESTPGAGTLVQITFPTNRVLDG